MNPETSVAVLPAISQPIPDSRFPTPDALVKYPEAVLAQERRDRAKMFLATTLILVVLLGFFAAAAGIVYVATDQGTLEITSHVDNIKIEVIGDNGSVKVLDLVSGTTVERLKSGQYTVVVQGDNTNVAIDKGKFQMTRGGKVAVTAILQTNRPKPPPSGDQEKVAGETVAVPSLDNPTTPSEIANRPLVQFTDHKSDVRGVAFSPDDRQFVTVGWDKMIHVYDTQTRARLYSWLGHDAGIYRARYLPDGRLLTSAYDGTIKLWDVARQHELKQLIGHTGPVTALAVSPDGKRVFASGSDKSIRLWNLDESVSSERKVEQGEWIWDAAFAPDGQTVASVSFDGKVRLWNGQTGEAAGEFVAHQGAALSIVWVGDKQVLTGGRDGAIRLWDVESKTKIAERPDLEGIWIESLTVSKDGRRALAALANIDKHEQPVALAGHCAVLDIPSLRIIRFLPSGAPYIYGTAMSADGQLALLAIGRRDGLPYTAQLWDISTAVAGGPGDTSSTPAAKVAEVAPATGAVAEIKHASQLNGHGGPVFGLAVAADGLAALSTSDDYFTRVWDLSTRRQVREFKADGAMRCVAVTADGSLAAWSGGQKTIVVWDLKQNKELTTLHGHTHWVYSLQFTKDNRRLLSISRDKTVRLWDLESGTATFQLETINRQDIVARLSPDETKILASSDNFYTLTLWNVADGKPLAKLHGHGVEGVYAAAFSPDGTQIATADGKGAIHLRDATSGEPRVTWLGHQGRVTSLAFTPDSRHLVSGGFDRKLHLWDAQTGQLVARAVAAAPVTNHLAVLPGGNQVLTAGGWYMNEYDEFQQPGDFALHLWDLPPEIVGK